MAAASCYVCVSVVLLMLQMAVAADLAAGSRAQASHRWESSLFAAQDSALVSSSVVVPFQPLTPLNASAANVTFANPVLLRLPTVVIAAYEGVHDSSPNQPMLYISTSTGSFGDPAELRWSNPAPVNNTNLADPTRLLGMWSPALYYDKRTSTVFLYYSLAAGYPSNGTLFVVWSSDDARTWSSPVAVVGPHGPMRGFISGGSAVAIPSWLRAAGNDGENVATVSAWMFLVETNSNNNDGTNGSTFLVEANMAGDDEDMTNVTYTVSSTPVVGNEFTKAVLVRDGATGGMAVVAASKDLENSENWNSETVVFRRPSTSGTSSTAAASSALVCRVAPLVALDAEWSTIQTLPVSIPRGTPFGVVSPGSNNSWIAVATVSNDNASSFVVTAVDVISGNIAQSGALTFPVFALDPSMRSIAIAPVSTPPAASSGNGTWLLLAIDAFGVVADAVVELDVSMSPSQRTSNKPTTAIVVTFSIIGAVIVILIVVFVRGKWCARNKYNFETTTLLREHHLAHQGHYGDK